MAFIRIYPLDPRVAPLLKMVPVLNHVGLASCIASALFPRSAAIVCRSGIVHCRSFSVGGIRSVQCSVKKLSGMGRKGLNQAPACRRFSSKIGDSCATKQFLGARCCGDKILENGQSSHDSLQNQKKQPETGVFETVPLPENVDQDVL